MKVSNSDYHVVFTSGATAGCKLVGELYPWKTAEGKDRSFVYANCSHNSIIGIRNFSSKFFTFSSSAHLETVTLPPVIDQSIEPGSLVAFPAQCNFTGLKYALENVNIWKNAGFKVLLDVASFISTSPLSLRDIQPDFVVLSFYKIFGYPTGLGALLIKTDNGTPSPKSSFTANKRYFGGGTVGAVLNDRDWVKFRESTSESLEDGTLNFLSIVSLKHGFAAIDRVGGMTSISKHTFTLIHSLVTEMARLEHFNSSKLCELYGWTSKELGELSSGKLEDVYKRHGPIVTFNLKRADGTYIGYNEFEKLSSQCGFQLRTGCFCNPGACQT